MLLLHRPGARILPAAALLAACLLSPLAMAQEPAPPADNQAAAAPAQDERPPRKEFFDIALGQNALEMDSRDFMEYACGTNGGPPAKPLKGWADFAQCRAEPATGYHEIQFRYDDEDEFWAKARNIPHLVSATEGTKLYIIPVITSGLFDEDGFLVGLRAITDPRVTEDQRMQAVALRNFMMGRLDPEGWTCEKLTEEEGERPIASRYLKERCTKEIDGVVHMLESHHYRKEGQYGLDPRTNQPVEGLFRSDVRYELSLKDGIPDRAARLAALSDGQSEAAAEIAALREKVLNCPGCDLTGVQLKRVDLTGANLAGANLSGANLHGALLIKADLTGANLSGANLNRANLRQAQLAGANLTEALMFTAILDGANLAGADLTRSRMGEAQMVRANLEGVKMVAVEATRARLTDANLKDADLGGTWFPEANLQRTDFSNANMIQMLLANAHLANANLSNAVVSGSDLIGADLRGANLSNANFSGTRMTSTLLTNTNREGTNFENVVGMPR